MSSLEELSQFSVMWPSLLWLLAPLPLVVAIYLRLDARQRRAYARLSGLSLFPEGGSAGSRLRRVLPPLLFLVGLTAFDIANARDQLAAAAVKAAA